MSRGSATFRSPRGLLLGFALSALVGCEVAYPEIVIVNRTAPELQLRDLSFSGCVWPTVLAFGEATSVERCLPGEDRVHFKTLDVSVYRPGETPTPDAGAGGALPIPLWFNYQTASLHRVDYGDVRVFEITLDGLEQDFSIPGPYGH